ncbi:hypothetical protein FRB97_001080 [Tulasnella sp. 331]|nr:hypothetical protein FRB97_001080 [Tulasnella sp. 331]
MAADVVNGQLVTAGIVIAFLATFLMREWVAQNAMPGVFGDDEAGLLEVNVVPEIAEEVIVEAGVVPAGGDNGGGADEDGNVVMRELDEEFRALAPTEAVVPHMPTALEAPSFPLAGEQARQEAPLNDPGPNENFIEGLCGEIAPGEEESERVEYRRELAEAETLQGGLDVVLPNDPSAEDGVDAVNDAEDGGVESAPTARPRVRPPPALDSAGFHLNRRWAFHPSASTWPPPSDPTVVDSSSPEASSSAASPSTIAGSTSTRLEDKPTDGKGSIYAAIMAKRAIIPPDLSPALPLSTLPVSNAWASPSTLLNNHHNQARPVDVAQPPHAFRSDRDTGGSRGAGGTDLRQLLMEANKLTEEFKKLKEAKGKGKDPSPTGSWTEIDHPIGSEHNSEGNIGGLPYDERYPNTVIDGAGTSRSVFPFDLGSLRADDLSSMSQEYIIASLDPSLQQADRFAKQDVKGKGRAILSSDSSESLIEISSFDADPFADPPVNGSNPFANLPIDTSNPFANGPPPLIIFKPSKAFYSYKPRTVKELPSRRRQRFVRPEQGHATSTSGPPLLGMRPFDESQTGEQAESSRPAKIHRAFSAASGGDKPAVFSATDKKATIGSAPDFAFTFTLPVNDPVPQRQGAATSEGVSVAPNGSASLWLQRSNVAVAGPSRRPGLPPTTPNGGPVVDPLGAGSNSQAGSPGLATYRPPEELHADGYFPRNPTPKDATGAAGAVAVQGNGAQAVEPPAQPPADNLDPGNQENEDPFDLAGPPDVDDDLGDDAPPDAQNDDFEPDEELDGIMEAIGMRGALGNVFQNALLMSILLDLVLIVGLFLPYTVGKTAALVALKPRQGVLLVKLPIRIVRILTDPIVEIAILLVKLVIAPALLILGRSIAFLLSAKSSRSSQPTDVSANGLTHWVQNSVTRHARLLVVRCRSEWRSSGLRNATIRLATHYLEHGEPGAVARFRMRLLDKERQHAEAWRRYTESWTEHALGNGPRDRMFAVAVGYVVLTVLVAVYLGLSSSAAGVPRRALRSAVRQQLIVIKVAIFIFIELVLFPLGCGTMIDFSTLPLFESHTLQNRIAFLHHAPVTCIFIHWMIGTMFMYQFAVWLSSIRSIIRRGGMWFIKDPGDPNFHPIRDMLDRPVLTQLRKLWMSAMMYFGVIALGAGSVLFLIRQTSAYTAYPLFPLRWNMRETLSVIPFDLLILSVVTPVTIGKLRMRRAVLYSLSLWWPFMSRQLRLSSYMFGGRWVDEEMFDLRGPVSRWTDWFTGQPRRYSKFRGGFRRAPAVDSVVFPPNTRGLVVVNEEGRPISQQEVELAVLQDEACRKVGAAPEDSFTLLYVPPFFRLRIYLFICSLWITAAAATLACLAVPVYLGRASVHLVGRAPIHDGYTWTIGVYILWALALMWKECQRQSRRGISTPQRMLKNATSRVLGIAYLVVTIGIITPILLALVINFYLILPVRIDLGMSKPDIHIVDMWALGLIYMKIGDSMSRWHLPNKHTRAFRLIIATAFRHPNIQKATTDFIVPTIVGLILMIIVPPIMVVGLRILLPSLNHPDATLVYGYPALFVVSSLVACIDWLMRVFQSWVQRTRDAEFLLELRLSNLEKQEDKQDEAKEMEMEPKELPVVQ